MCVRGGISTLLLLLPENTNVANFVGIHAEIIPCGALPNSFDMLDGHTAKLGSGHCNGMGQPLGLVNTLRHEARCLCIQCEQIQIDILLSPLLNSWCLSGCLKLTVLLLLLCRA